MRMMRKSTGVLSLTAFFVIIGAVVTVLMAKEYQRDLFRQVEDFSRFQINTFPGDWKSRGGNGAEVYRVKSDGEGYLEAKADKTAVTIAKAFTYELKEYPLLHWEWKAVVLPEGGDERYKKTGDSAAGIYVIFSGLLPKNIKYVWSSSLPVGTNTKSPYTGRTEIVVLQNNSSPLETWVSEEVNVYKDYRRLFGEEPSEVQGIGIMTDSDNTKSIALAHYRRLSVSKTPAQ
jgi:hypothetical protein